MGVQTYHRYTYVQGVWGPVHESLCVSKGCHAQAIRIASSVVGSSPHPQLMPGRRGCSEDGGGLPPPLPHPENSKFYAAQGGNVCRRICMWPMSP